jgi:SAM-dependent methyltransferase
MSLFLASAERLVIAADLSRLSLELGAEAARRFGLDRVLFAETDLREPGLQSAAFDVVYCSGVLHHTPDPRRSLAALARLVRPGGYILVGLYNAIARIPHGLRRTVARLTGLNKRVLDPVLRERWGQPDRREAWLRDQYQHPEEHWHTLSEVKRWFRENDIEYLRSYPPALVGRETNTSGGLFNRIDDDWWLEEWLIQASWITRLSREGGLFVVVGQRSGEPRKSGTR